VIVTLRDGPDYVFPRIEIFRLVNTPSTDQEQLQLLAIFHYIVGGLGVFFACFPLIHFGFGMVMIFSPQSFGDSANNQPPAFFGWLFATLGAVFFLIGQTMAVCIIFTGRFLQRRTRYTFVFVMACIECLLMPFGTVLGVFTIIVMSRESVKRLFGRPPADAGGLVA
jgi:hypothetical protein